MYSLRGKIMKQLIIVGNGLDLTAELPTRYDDFFAWLKAWIGEINYSITRGNSAIYSESTVSDKFAENFDFWTGWFLTIYKRKFMDEPVEWNDVENQIEKVLRGLFVYNESTTYESLLRYANLKVNMHKGDWREAFTHTLNYYFLDWLYYLNSNGSIEDSNKKLDLYKLLLEDLHKFETKFATYLCEEVMNEERVSAFIGNNRNELYTRNILLGNIVNRNSPYTIEDTKIINFNYTPIVSKSGDTSEELEKHVQYIHGSLGLDNSLNYTPCKTECVYSSIIFGIDDTSLMSKDNEEQLRSKLFKFGKTYRIMNSLDNISLDINKEIKIVKFYGHSLNSADYAYFQSIFDTVNLYESDVKLYFYYGDFENEKNERMSMFMDRIYKLIETYGRNIFENSSEARGKNLLHKLILEGRIKTIYVPKYEV